MDGVRGYVWLALMLFGGVTGGLTSPQNQAPKPRMTRAEMRQEIAELKAEVKELRARLDVYEAKEEAEKQALREKYSRWHENNMRVQRRTEWLKANPPPYDPNEDFIGGGG